MNRELWQLRTASRNYYDAYRHKTRISNRLRALAREGDTYDPSTEPMLMAQLESVEKMKDESARLMTRIYRATAPQPIVEFQEATPGLGEIWVARLIGEVGDLRTYTEAWWEDGASYDPHHPLSKDPEEDLEAEKLPKRVLAIGDDLTMGVRELWAYCGHGDPERRRRRGQTQEEALSSGNPTAKMVVHQMAEFALRLNGVADKNGRERAMTPYYPAYIRAKEHAQQLHGDWRPGHVNTHGIRVAGKEILRDLWRVQHGHKPVYGDHSKLDPWVPRRPLEVA